jgi:hypothetical protein
VHYANFVSRGDLAARKVPMFGDTLAGKPVNGIMPSWSRS